MELIKYANRDKTLEFEMIIKEQFEKNITNEMFNNVVSRIKGWKDIKLKEKMETEYETAIREGCEELSGIFGEVETLEELVKKTNSIIKTKTYYTYLMEVKYDKNKEQELKDIYIKTLNENPDLIYKHNGLYEKDRGLWISIDDVDSFRTNMRRWYNYILTKIIAHFK